MSKSSFSHEYRMLLSKLKESRLQAGFTQKQVASKLGRQQSFVSKVESGERRLDVVEMAELMQLYNAPMDMILHDVLGDAYSVGKPKKKPKKQS